MDIRKLQRAIVDGLEDVKAADIVVLNTEHLSALFERVIVASGTSNRQTRALASSVRNAVKAADLPVLRIEGESNGEWIIVDCGAAVVHIMQPAIRDYYHLEEIWGGKSVRMKMTEAPRAGQRLPKASAASDKKAVPGKKPAAKTAAKKVAVKKGPAKKAPARKAATQAAAPKRALVAKTAAKKAVPSKTASKAAPKKAVTPRASVAAAPVTTRVKTVVAKPKPAAKRGAVASPRAPAKKTPAARKR